MFLAKNHYEDGELIKETIIEHIEYCLEIAEELFKVFPEIVDSFGGNQIGKKIIFITICLHDLGKASKAFQEITLDPDTKESWHFRHEVLSAEFVNLLKNQEDRHKKIIQLAILGHHEKNIEELSKISYLNEEAFAGFLGLTNKYSEEKERIYKEAKEQLKNNWHNVTDVLEWIEKKYRSYFNENIELFKTYDKLENICYLIDDYNRCYRSYDTASFDYDLVTYLKGILVTCDHLGSAHSNVKHISHDIMDYYVHKFKIGLEKGNDFRSSQKLSTTHNDSLLIAPTGSGKTEASFLWANEHLKKNKYRRVFYVLPYTASINGMEERLEEEEFSKGKVDMKHGKTLYSYYYKLLSKFYENSDVLVEDKRKIQKLARLMKQTSKEISNPIKILTPHQIIKAFFNVKGFETLITEFNNSLFIFDEIHCYDEELFALIIVTMRYIKQRLNGKLFFMSATFPKVIKEIIKEKLEIHNEIQMNKAELTKFTRHRLRLLNGRIEDDNNLDKIRNQIKSGKRVLIICNTVKKAQMIFKQVSEYTDSKLLLHGYYAQKDRKAIEEMLLKGEKREKDFVPIQVLVATQAVEVSLDLDFDTCFTEIAVIDALIQRFGRVFRKRKIENGNYGIVNVFLESDKGTKFIYDNKDFKFLDKTLEKLKEYHDKILETENVQDMVDYIYDNEYKIYLEELVRYWEEIFNKRYSIPLGEYSVVNQEYFDQFDSMKICPEEYLEEYKKLINGGLYLEANSLLIPITSIKFANYIYKNFICDIKFKDRYYKEMKVIIARSLFLNYHKEIGLFENEDEKGITAFM